MLTPEAEPLVDFDWGVQFLFVGIQNNFWEGTPPPKNGTRLFILGQHYRGPLDHENGISLHGVGVRFGASHKSAAFVGSKTGGPVPLCPFGFPSASVSGKQFLVPTC